jgi:Flp pilus assembly protein TadB
MLYATFLYLLLAAFVIWVWSPPAILRMLVLIVLILLYSWTSSRLAKKK